MQVFVYDVKGKLEVPYPELARSSKAGSDAWFWVVHPTVTPKQFIESDEFKRTSEDCLNRGGAILFLSGFRCAGWTESEARDQEREKNNRVHSLRVACAGNSPKIGDRIGRFLSLIETIEPWAEIPWKAVEPAAWPESLVAVYLVLKALEASPKDADRIRQAWNDLDPSWRHQLWKDAWTEYHEERGLSDIPWTAVHLPTPEKPQFDLPEPAMLSEAVKVLKLSISG